MQGHPEHKQSRLWSSILLLDSLIRLLALTTLDADRPDSQYAIFGTYVSNMAQFSLTASPNAMHVMNCMNTAPGFLGNTKSSCDCDRYTLKRQWPAVSEIAPSWESTTLWPQVISEGELKKEECRRLVWSSVMLTAAYNSCIAADTQVDTGDLFIKDYENVCALLSAYAKKKQLTMSLSHSSMRCSSLERLCCMQVFHLPD